MRTKRRQPFLKRTLRYPLEAAGLYLGLSIFRALPVETASNFGAWLGRRLGPRLGISRRARRHLRFALPERDTAEIERILLGMWDNLGRVAGEYAHLRAITDPASGRVEEIGFERADSIRDPGTPGIGVSGHFANWEVMGAIANRQGVELISVVREPNNPLVRRVLESLRGVWGGERVPKGPESGLRIVEALKAGGVFGALIDQKINDGIAVPFFGKPAMTTPAIAILSRRFRCPIYPIRIERLGAARFRMTCYPALEIEPSGSRKADLILITARLNEILESWIRDRPEEWLWLHRRWPEATFNGSTPSSDTREGLR